MVSYLTSLEHGAERFEAEELEKKKKYCSEILGITCDKCPAECAWCPNNKAHDDFLKECGQIGLE